MHKLKKILEDNWSKILFVIISIIFSMPSVIFLAKHKSILNFFGNWTWLGRIPQSNNEKIVNALLFVFFMCILFFIYVYCIKNSNKIFKKTKSIIIFVAIISITFSLVIPFTSRDVYSYIASGWIDSNYHENPYYTSVTQITKNNPNDQMFRKVADCWRGEPVVYGPIWTLICKVLTSFSGGNLTIALFIFKIANLMIHLLNCLIIYKITNKKKFIVIYGLNPLILFEALSNVHNDIFVILFILLAIYFIYKKKNIALSIIFIAMATAIKYFTILLVPFIVLYGLKDKEKITEKIKYILIYALEFIGIIVVFYLIYLRDLKVLSGITLQQTKYNRSILCMLYFCLGENVANIIKNILLGIFVAFYIATILDMIKNNKKVRSIFAVIRKYNIYLLAFTFILITNFNPWYIMWLFPTIMFLKKNSINTIINLSFASQIANICSFAFYNENAWTSIPYWLIMIITTFILSLIRKYKNGKLIKR